MKFKTKNGGDTNLEKEFGIRHGLVSLRLFLRYYQLYHIFPREMKRGKRETISLSPSGHTPAHSASETTRRKRSLPSYNTAIYCEPDRHVCGRGGGGGVIKESASTSLLSQSASQASLVPVISSPSRNTPESSIPSADYASAKDIQSRKIEARFSDFSHFGTLYEIPAAEKIRSRLLPTGLPHNNKKSFCDFLQQVTPDVAKESMSRASL